jgi:diguanylate cyclase (GGDEF)-like protein
MINELSRFKRSSEVYSLLMFDIDHFKRINDNYGHSTGDIAIQNIAKSCQSILRSQDKIARIGGEEFCVLLPYTTKKSASEVAEKLKEIISNISIVTTSGNVTMTVSIGVSDVEETDTEHTAILKRADEKMYMAKKTGRNRVCL